MKINILYEDQYILALDKPSGLLVHSDGRSVEPTLVDWLNENYPALKTVGEPLNIVRGKEQKDGKRFTVSVVERPGIVHRLDKDTSGVIIIVKTKEAHEFLKEQFQNRKVEKIYNAVVWGNFSEDKRGGVIDKPIGRSASDFRKWSAEFGAKGELREAVTEYKVLAQNNEFAYLEVKPKTGRTHQIRVHLKSISHPVVCDKLYGRNNPPSPPYIKGGIEQKSLGFDRLALHAFSIRLRLPDNTDITIESPLPLEFENARKILS